MKLIVIAVLASAVSLQAQQAPKPPTAPLTSPQMAHPATPPPQPIPVEPKHSEATANLRAAEAEKHDLQTQSQAIVGQANAQLTRLRDQLAQKDKETADAIAAIKKENDWGDDVTYVPPTPQPDGTVVAGHWQKTPKK